MAEDNLIKAMEQGKEKKTFANRIRNGTTLADLTARMMTARAKLKVFTFLIILHLSSEIKPIQWLI